MSIASETPSRALIDGTWVDGGAGTFEVRSPHDGRLVNTVARCDADDVAQAVAAGAHIQQFCPEEGLYFPATILTDVTTDMRIMREETFGPVAPILKVSSAAEAVAIADESKLGLIASLWTRDLATAWRVGEALRTDQ
jgi:acyl-CoA reductase-like NAD-dependent aldehyde dehydrogenase